MPLDLVVPDLFPPASPDAPGFRLPALERWLDRAEAAREPGMTARRWIAAQYGLAGPVPYAALSRKGESDPLPNPPPRGREQGSPSPLGEGRGEGHVLRADPVHLAVGQDSITLHEAGMLGITAEEAAALVSSLNDLFAGDGLAFSIAAPGRWYVRVPADEVPATTPIDEVAGRNVFRRLPQGRGRVNWGSALTETQMLFAAHPVNAARESSRRPSINGVWFWGEGALPAELPRAYDAVRGGDEVVRGIARLSGAEPAAGDASALWMLDEASRALRAGDALGWQRALEALEPAVFALLDNLAARYGRVRLVVPDLDGTRIFTGRKKPLLSWPGKASRPWTTHA